ncbi:FG-GAP repeat protein [Phycisphaerae bacterium RAS1]|nr:FG-GAP repeat protein [Phycisphaerae bacterium RAS1]
MRTSRIAVAALLLSLAPRLVLAPQPNVASHVPARNALTAAVDASISVTFDQPINLGSITPASFKAFGKWSGAALGAYSFSNADQTVTLTPAQPFSAGESVMAVLANTIEAADGSPLRAAGFSWQFWVAAKPATLAFRQVDVLTTRTTPGQPTTAYGGVGADLDGDRFLDITIVNEDTDDLRVFMNSADGSGLFDPFMTPTHAVGNVPSPCESADFNGDGRADIAVCNTVDTRVSVLLGNGDGTYQAQQAITVGSAPRGMAVLDADGDGDVDIVNSNNSSNNMSLILNNGAGVFGAATSFEGGGTGEWSVAAADMTSDGIMDIVIGCRSSNTIVVRRGLGGGVFQFVSSRAAGGSPWQIATGDFNGDGHADVATSNSGSATGSILLGDGAGNLSAAVTSPMDPFPIATDVGDMDGDGDLDWCTSSYSGDWFLYTNNGNGTFTFNQEFISTSAASCALLLDIDNDGDLDLGLIDEIADEILIMKQRGPRTPGDMNCDGALNVLDINPFVLALGDAAAYAAAYPDCLASNADTNGDTQVNVLDINPFVALLAGP